MKDNFILVFIITLCLASFSMAQDLQSTYEEAKNALLEGDYRTSLIKIADVKNQIQADPKIDPNQTFANKLLPPLEANANRVADIAAQLEALYNTSTAGLMFPDLFPSQEAVDQYNQHAQMFSTDLYSKRDALLNDLELAPEFREALRKIPVVQNIEVLATKTVMQRLSEKVNQVAEVFVDSLKAVDGRYKQAQEKIAVLMQNASANKAEMQRLKKEMEKLSEDRMHYMSAISQMLEGEATSEIMPLRQTLSETQVQDSFSQIIQAEIARLEGITSVDSLGYKELLKSYERIKNYNQIFLQNNISADQSLLLAQYEAALKSVKVVEPSKIKLGVVAGIVVAIWGLVVIVIIYAMRKRRKHKEDSDDTQVRPLK